MSLLEDPDYKPASAVKSRGLLIGLLILMVLIAVLGTVMTMRYLAQRRVTALQTELDRTDPGWRLIELEAQRPIVPDAQNNASEITAAYALLPAPWPDWKLYVKGSEPALQIEEEQILGVSFENLTPAARLHEKQLVALRGELGRAAQAREAALILAKMPRGRFSIAMKPDVVSTLLPHIENIHRVKDLLVKDALLRIEDKDLVGAATSCRALVHLGRSVAEEPMLVSQLSYLTVRLQAMRLMERLLAQGELSDKDLVPLQLLLKEEAAANPFLTGALADRAATNQMLTAVRNGDLPLQRFLEMVNTTGQLSVEDVVLIGLQVGHLEGYHRRALEHLTEGVRIARLPSQEQLAALKAWDEAYKRLPTIVARLCTNPMRFGETVLRNNALTRCALVAVALERFRLANQRWPANLDELTPKYLAQLPTDPFTGQPLRYRPAPTGVVVYSVSLDGNDDSGNLSVDGCISNSDLGMQLWNVDQRRQPAKPWPRARSVQQPMQPVEKADP